VRPASPRFHRGLWGAGCQLDRVADRRKHPKDRGCVQDRHLPRSQI